MSRTLSRTMHTTLKNNAPLTREEEATATEWELVTANIRFVVDVVAKEFAHVRELSFQEMVSAGVMGLIDAAKRFDPSYGNKFISYSIHWIRQSIFLDLKKTHLIRIPQSVLSNEYKAKVYGAGAISESQQAAVDHARTLKNPLSLEYQVEEDDATFAETVPDDAPLPDDELERQSERDAVLALLATLKPREADILSMYFGIGGYPEHTLEEIGLHYGFTRERARQIKKVALRKLQYPLNTSRRKLLQGLR